MFLNQAITDVIFQGSLIWEANDSMKRKSSRTDPNSMANVAEKSPFVGHQDLNAGKYKYWNKYKWHRYSPCIRFSYQLPDY